MDGSQRKRSHCDDENAVKRKIQCVAKSDGLSVSDAVKFGSGVETNQQRIEMRNKQIQFGKNTIGYDNYLALVPKNKRKSSAVHPRTPNPYDDVSKRCFDGQIKAWRRELHKWDNMEMTLVAGINNKQKNPLKEKEEKLAVESATTVDEIKNPEIEELEQDVYKSDGETFDDEDIL